MADRRARLVNMTAVVGGLMIAATALAGSVQSPSPYWFQDSYTSLFSVNPSATTAAISTTGTGTVQLPYAPLGVAFDPAGTYALVATDGGVYAYVFDGQGVVPVTNWSLGSLPATGVTWVNRGSAFAVTTTSEVALYGLSASSAGYDATLVVKASAAGIIGAAPGPAVLPGAVLAATASGAMLYESQGTSLVAISGGPTGLADNLGVAAPADGSVAATWQAGAVQLWTWDGSAYEPATAWDPPAPPPADGPIVSVAFFPKGDGYWVLTRQGQLLTYAFGPTGLRRYPDTRSRFPRPRPCRLPWVPGGAVFRLGSCTPRGGSTRTWGRATRSARTRSGVSVASPGRCTRHQRCSSRSYCRRGTGWTNCAWRTGRCERRMAPVS